MKKSLGFRQHAIFQTTRKIELIERIGAEATDMTNCMSAQDLLLKGLLHKTKMLILSCRFNMHRKKSAVRIAVSRKKAKLVHCCCRMRNRAMRYAGSTCKHKKKKTTFVVFFFVYSSRDPDRREKRRKAFRKKTVRWTVFADACVPAAEPPGKSRHSDQQKVPKSYVHRFFGEVLHALLFSRILLIWAMLSLNIDFRP